MSIMRHRIMTVLLSLFMTFAVIAAPAFVPASANSHTVQAATTFSDISNHWGKSYIEQAVSYGIVNGYSDGTFRPDNSVTRAEFTKMINTALGNTSTVTPELTDVDSSQWFYNDVAKGVAASFISGYEDGSFRPDATITRQEAAVVLSRIVPTAGSEASINSYQDASEVADWAETAMRKIVGKKYMTGSDNKLTPADSLTRAQAAKIIVQIKSNEKIISNNQTIVKDGITIEDTIYANQISVGSQVGSGTSTLSNCVVLGNVNVQGGGGEGDKGVILKNSRIVKLTVNRDDECVQVFTQGESTVLNTYIDETASLIEVNQSESGEFGKGFADVYMSKKSELTLSGSIELLQMQGAKCDASVESGATISQLEILDSADRCDVTLEKDASIGSADVYGDMASFYGKGTVAEMNVMADSLTYTTVPEEMNIADTVKIKPTRIVDPSLALTITASPENGASSVDTSSNIVLNFSSAVHITNSTNTVLTDEEAASLFELRKDSTSGYVVPCDVTVSENGTCVTIDPKGSLAHGTDYMITLYKDNLTDEYGNTNDALQYSIHTSGSKTSETASLTSLEAGVQDGSDIDYSALSVVQGAVNNYYIGTDAVTLTIKAESDTPNPLITVSLGTTSSSRTIGEDGTVSFSIASGTADPGTITVSAGSYDGDYEEQMYTINVKRINPNIASVSIPLRGAQTAGLTLYNSVSAAEASDGDAVSSSSLSGTDLLMKVSPQESSNTEGISITVEKYDPDLQLYESMDKSASTANAWVIGTASSSANASGIYRVTLTSRIGGSTPAGGSVAQTVVKYVKVNFAS